MIDEPGQQLLCVTENQRVGEAGPGRVKVFVRRLDQRAAPPVSDPRRYRIVAIGGVLRPLDLLLGAEEQFLSDPFE
jgi:hypothetical protein